MRPVLVAVCAALLTGCASEAGERDASTVAVQFVRAAGAGDTPTACALLTPKARDDLVASEGRPCAESLPADRLGAGPVRGVDVWSDQAQVTTDAGTVFLTEFDDGWLVSAAGCRPNGAAPYLCVVGG